MRKQINYTNADKSSLFYDKVAQKYGLVFDQVFTQYLKFQILDRYTDSKDQLLDVGIANGILSIPIAKKVKTIIGVDNSRKMLREASANFKKYKINNVKLIECSATKLQIPSNSVDVAFSYSTLLLVPDFQKALSEMYRVIKSGGLIIIDVTGKYNISQLVWNKFYKSQGLSGINSFSLPEIKSIIAGYKLEIVEIHALGFLDQWKYIPILNKFRQLEHLFHEKSKEPDRDYRISNMVPTMANRWYFVLRK